MTNPPEQLDELGLEPGGFIRERFWLPADLEIRSDGRTLYGIAVPYDQVATVNDGRGNYQEMFRRGSFAKTLQEGGARVKLMANHDARRFPIGKATNLREDAHGLVGEFRVSETRDGDEALQLVRDGVLDAFSVGFRPVKHVRNNAGVVERHEVDLREVSVVAFPAYAGAGIAGVRMVAKHPDTHDEEAADGTSFDGAVDLTAEPVRHSLGPAQSERLLRAFTLKEIKL